MRASLTRKVAIITAGAALASWTLIAAQPAGAWPVDFASCNTVTLTSDLTTQTTGQLLRLAPHCTYDLTAALPDITAQPVTIWAGPGTVLERSTAPDAPPFSLLTVDSGASLTVSGLTLTGAVASTGGAIDNYGTLTVTRSTFTDDTAAFGGAIASGLNGSATLTISRSDFTSNNASSKGGAVANWSSGTATIRQHLHRQLCRKLGRRHLQPRQYYRQRLGVHRQLHHLLRRWRHRHLLRLPDGARRSFHRQHRLLGRRRRPRWRRPLGDRQHLYPENGRLQRRCPPSCCTMIPPSWTWPARSSAAGSAWTAADAPAGQLPGFPAALVIVRRSRTACR